MNKKILLLNPYSAKYGYRIPNSILQIAASIDQLHDYVIVDGNREKDPWNKIKQYLDSGTFTYFGCTVMPGPQLKQAIPFTKKIKELYPSITTIWGGYFASNQYKTAILSGYVDYIIDGPGDKAFPALLNILENGGDLNSIPNLIHKINDKIIKNEKEALLDQDTLPPLPYNKLNSFYPISGYLKKTFLGKKTAAYHSSMGCPFTCSFCAVVPIYNARWKGKSAKLIYKDIKYLKDTYHIDAVEFHDNNFFVSEKRTVEFSNLIKNDNIVWWGEGRIDTINKYSDESLSIMSEAGCKMIFFGAETSSDEILAQMDKGGTQTTKQIKEFAGRMRKFGIIPEYSFVLGMPGESDEKVEQQIDQDIVFIREIKEINPDTEVIIYVYSPVPTEGSELFKKVTAAGFVFPQKLEDWLAPEWEKFDLRRNPLTPWLKSHHVKKIKNFETILNAVYPSVTDIDMNPFYKKTLKLLGNPRYKKATYRFSKDLKLIQKIARYKWVQNEGF